MPELPEVETTRRALAAKLLNQQIAKATVRQPSLRWPIPSSLSKNIRGQTLQSLNRRGKYLLFSFASGTLLVHLGMSGSLRLLAHYIKPSKHDHVDILFDEGYCLRYNDPRRFGAFLWCEADPLAHPLLSSLGPEPLSAQFNTRYLLAACQNRRVNIKTLIMNSKVVVGVGNIYASEALYRAQIHPLSAAHSLTQTACAQLVSAIKQVLRKAIHAGGTTLNDFYQTDGKPGYFSQQLKVYGRADEPCFSCQALVHKSIIAQRSTFFCNSCQTLFGR